MYVQKLFCILPTFGPINMWKGSCITLLTISHPEESTISDDFRLTCMEGFFLIVSWYFANTVLRYSTKLHCFSSPLMTYNYFTFHIFSCKYIGITYVIQKQRFLLITRVSTDALERTLTNRKDLLDLYLNKMKSIKYVRTYPSLTFTFKNQLLVSLTFSEGDTLIQKYCECIRSIRKLIP